ncbi:serine/threonine-protein phosphatase CPPED1-like [Thrips palmi]|uniref:Serine/threonine-protein phosphatase CPPED1 n=1 Tax=Thrips palmi TaxID=161013 RepID=A0A6P9ACX3_THRPL|nr:serine/threonine-protein phosphatase CPPED1-like [Thrips palmi]
MAASWKTHTKDRKFIFFNEASERVASDPFFFIQGADCQLGLKDMYIAEKKGLPPPTGHYWEDEIKLAKKAVECINNMQPPPSFVVICGDLINAFPDADKEMRAQQEKDFKEIMSKLNPSIPLVCVCGNHDVGNQPTPESVAVYRSSFGDDYFSFWQGGVLFLVLNSQYYFDSTKIHQIQAEQEAWLDTMLEEGKKKEARIVAFQHIPMFIKDVDEPDQYFNIPKNIRKPLLAKLESAGVTHIFCGHLHYNAYGLYKSMEIVTTSAIGYQLGKDTHGMRVVKVKGGSLEHSYHSLENFPKEITL